MTREHLIRLALIAVVFLAALAALVYLSVKGQTEGTLFGVVMGWLTLAGPALLDSGRVATAQRRDAKRASSLPPIAQ